MFIIFPFDNALEAYIMNEKNYEMLIENIENLMKEHNIKQSDLIKATKIPQPQMSKGLNRQNKGQFTFEQIWKIADYFKVSIDFLVGRNPDDYVSGSLSIETVCRQLMQLVESDMVTCREIEVEEYMYTEDPYPQPGDYPYIGDKEKNKYIAFYFSNYFNPDLITSDKETLEDLQIEFSMRGNSNETNKEINKFISCFLRLYDLLKKNDLSRDVFDTAISGILKNLEK